MDGLLAGELPSIRKKLPTQGGEVTGQCSREGHGECYWLQPASSEGSVQLGFLDPASETLQEDVLWVQ